MAVAQMVKVIIISHRTQVSELLEALQREGICHILNAQEAMVSKDMPELVAEAEAPKDIQRRLDKLGKSIAFLKNYAESSKGLGSVLAPRTVVDERVYNNVVSSEEILGIVEQCRECEVAIEGLETERENLLGVLEQLRPWESLETPVEEIGRFEQTTALAGLIPTEQFDELKQQLDEPGAAIEIAASSGSKYACIVVGLNQNAGELQKLLRSADFETVSFEGMAGTPSELIKQNSEKLEDAENRLKAEHKKGVSLSKNLLKLEILYDHYENLLNREKTMTDAPATEQTVLLEGWVKKDDFSQLEETVSKFGASSLHRIEPAESEEIPVEIENKNVIKPFEVITRIYGMPRYFEVDPTLFLAPFFALFFGICLTDAGYGLLVVALLIWMTMKMQGDRKFMWMLVICFTSTVIAGAATGGWFGDAVQQFAPALIPLRQKVLWFDPLEEPMKLFVLALGLGYLQIMVGLTVGFVHYLRRRDFAAAFCEKFSWLVLLNSIMGLVFVNAGLLPGLLGNFLPWAIIVSAIIILLFSQRQGGWGGRFGMGLFQLFSTVFYVGDVLSYVRLMALGITTAALAMAINTIARAVSEIPVVGIILAIAIFVGGHVFNAGLSALGAFAHTLRLQFVEFLPKFFVGGGKPFEPLSKRYRHVYIEKF